MTPPPEIRSALWQVREAGGPELVERLMRLDALGAEANKARERHVSHRPEAPPSDTVVDYDVVLAGGGLSLLCAPLLARRGFRVAVFDAGRIGASHREWNASLDELAPLWETGLLPEADVRALVLNHYRHGICRWDGGATYPVTGALDCAVDAGGLLSAVRAEAVVAGVALHDFHTIHGETGGPDAVCFRGIDGAQKPFEGTARLLLDARGAASPWARGDLTCPTVGGVMRGLDVGVDDPSRIDPTVGEILVTTEGVEAGRQHIWEAFPGRPGETTVYLFAYESAAARRSGDLVRLYARFFERLCRYKSGPAMLVRPTFGHIPGWTRRRGAPTPQADHPRIVLLGDAASRHSPLTFCGFGKALRSFAPVVESVSRALERGNTPAAPVPEDALHALTGALAWLMANPSVDPARAGALNRLLDTAFGRLHALGPAAYRGLLRDRMEPRDFLRFVRETAALRPEVYGEVFRALGPFGATGWAMKAMRRAVFAPQTPGFYAAGA